MEKTNVLVKQLHIFFTSPLIMWRNFLSYPPGLSFLVQSLLPPLWDHSVLRRASIMAQMIKYITATLETWVWFLDREDPLKKGMATHSVFLLGEFHGHRSLVSYSPWGHKESDKTEQLTLWLCPKEDAHRGGLPWWKTALAQRGLWLAKLASFR